jgi:hypothetical protein
MIQIVTAGHEADRSAISINSGTASNSRVIVTAFAGVANADGPKAVSETLI